MPTRTSAVASAPAHRTPGSANRPPEAAVLSPYRMSEELDLLILVADRLDAVQVPYMLSGSTAMNVYAEPRMTRDIDLVVEIGAHHVDTLAGAFADEFYCDRDMIRQAVAHQGA